VQLYLASFYFLINIKFSVIINCVYIPGFSKTSLYLLISLGSASDVLFVFESRWRPYNSTVYEMELFVLRLVQSYEFVSVCLEYMLDISVVHTFDLQDWDVSCWKSSVMELMSYLQFLRRFVKILKRE